MTGEGHYRRKRSDEEDRITGGMVTGNEVKGRCMTWIEVRRGLEHDVTNVHDKIMNERDENVEGWQQGLGVARMTLHRNHVVE